MTPTTTKKTTVKKTTTRKPVVRKTTTHAKIVHKISVKPTTNIRVFTQKHDYIFAVGRRKEAVARVRWNAKEDAKVTINGREFIEYFPTFELQHLVMQPLIATQNDKIGSGSAKVAGGGINGQAESVRLGISRALVKVDPDLRLVLKRAGFLRRDPRAKERKKYGLKRARRAPQWQKR